MAKRLGAKKKKKEVFICQTDEPSPTEISPCHSWNLTSSQAAISEPLGLVQSSLGCVWYVGSWLSPSS